MRRFFANTPVAVRLVLAGLIPVLAFLYLATAAVIDALQHRLTAMQTQVAGEIAPLLGSAINELQIQRGLSVLALAGKTDAARARSLAQQVKVDQAFGPLKAKVAGIGVDDVGEPIYAGLQRGLKVEQQLPDLRQRVNAGAIAPAEAAAQHTAMIAELIKVIYRVAEVQTDARMLLQQSSLVAVIEYKERAGLERATGARG